MRLVQNLGQVNDYLIDAFQKFKVRSTFGVIPYGCASDVYAPSPQDVALSALKADILRKAIKAGILEVALHGYCHQRVREGADGKIQTEQKQHRRSTPNFNCLQAEDDHP